MSEGLIRDKTPRRIRIFTLFFRYLVIYTVFIISMYILDLLLILNINVRLSIVEVTPMSLALYVGGLIFSLALTFIVSFIMMIALIDVKTE